MHVAEREHSRGDNINGDTGPYHEFAEHEETEVGGDIYTGPYQEFNELLDKRRDKGICLGA